MRHIGEYREFVELFAPQIADAYPSMADSFSESPVEGKDKILSYLHGGNLDAACAQQAVDVFTGKPIGFPDNARSDGVFEWGEALAHYVDEYNLRLPDEFVARALA